MATITLKRILTVSLTAGALLAITAGPALAGAPAAHTKARSAKQSKRIDNGKRSGQLTRAETVLLKAEQRKIDRTARRYKANDGRIGPAEKARLQRMQNKSSRHIYRAKHNGRTR